MVRGRRSRGGINSLVMILIGVCVIPVELIMDNILAGMRRLGPLQCDCGLADISCPEIARLWWHTWTRRTRRTRGTSTNKHIMASEREREGHVCVAHVRMRIFGFRFSVLVGLVIMKRKLRKLNKIQTNQYGIYLYMPISDIMQIPSLPSHTHTHIHPNTVAHSVKQMAEGLRNWLNCKQSYLNLFISPHNESSVLMRDHTYHHSIGPTRRKYFWFFPMIYASPQRNYNYTD